MSEKVYTSPSVEGQIGSLVGTGCTLTTARSEDPGVTLKEGVKSFPTVYLLRLSPFSDSFHCVSLDRPWSRLRGAKGRRGRPLSNTQCRNSRTSNLSMKSFYSVVIVTKSEP